MTKQFDVYRRPDGVLIVVVQHDILEDLKTRTILPLIPNAKGTANSRSLNPTVIFEGKNYVIATQFIATGTLPNLGMQLGDITYMRDEIIRALDLLITGV